MNREVRILTPATLQAFRFSVTINNRANLNGWDSIHTRIANLVTSNGLVHNPGVRSLGLWKPPGEFNLKDASENMSNMRFGHQGVIYRGAPATIEELDAFYTGDPHFHWLQELARRPMVHALGEIVEHDGQICTPEAYVIKSGKMVMSLRLPESGRGYDHYFLVSFRVDGEC